MDFPLYTTPFSRQTSPKDRTQLYFLRFRDLSGSEGPDEGVRGGTKVMMPSNSVPDMVVKDSEGAVLASSAGNLGYSFLAWVCASFGSAARMCSNRSLTAWSRMLWRKVRSSFSDDSFRREKSCTSSM